MPKPAIQLPATFEATAYREAWSDLSNMDDEQLQQHYWSKGLEEGRAANQLRSRQDFAALVPLDAPALEIGPFFRPLIRGPGVSYFDVLDTAALRARAASLGVDLAAIPTIDFMSPSGDLAVIKRTFANVLSSHCIEHQPDLILHLQHVSRLLEPGGRYFLLMPDRRYCFDHFQRNTTIADVLDDHRQQRTRHSLRCVVEHRAMTTHNDPALHWRGDHGSLTQDGPQRILEALAEYEAAGGGYIDVHAHYFTPSSFVELLRRLHDLALTDLVVEQIYPTRRDSDEFWAVLIKGGA